MVFTLSAYITAGKAKLTEIKAGRRKGLDTSIWFEHVERVNVGRSAANWRENRHYPKAILYQHAPVICNGGRLAAFINQEGVMKLSIDFWKSSPLTFVC